MDDEEEPIESLQILTDCNIDMLATKCKPLNISLDRLNLDKNGIILVKDDLYDRKSDPSPITEGEISTEVKSNRQENYSNDTAETIKKIKEFIAMGRCEDTKKEPETSEKVMRYKPGPLSKRKENSLKDSQNTKISRLNMGLELERTLKGQDDFSEVKESKEDSKDSSQPLLQKDTLFEAQVSEAMKNCESMTPSRVSKRIQNKSVKFSVKKMLRGDDANVLKRMIPGYDDDTPPKKERSAVLKPLRQEVKKIQQKHISSPTENSEEVHEAHEKENQVLEGRETIEPAKSPMESIILSPQAHDADLPSPVSSVPTGSSEQKVSSLAEKLGKFAAVTSGKITLELKGTPEKKVVRIAIPPPKSSPPLPKTSLGPDIIIKRVKPVKKTVVIQENVKPSSKTIIEKEIDDFKPPVSTTPRVIKLSGGVNVERIPAPKTKDEVLQIHKTILKRGRPPKKLVAARESRKMYEKKVNLTKESLPPEEPSAGPGDSTNAGTVKTVKHTAEDKKKEDSEEGPSLTQQITEALESTVSQLRGGSDSLQDGDFRGKVSVGKKLSKVSPLSHFKSKVESLAKKTPKPQKPDVVPEKSPLSSDIEDTDEKDLDNLFDRYFKTEERFIEHHDSLDSDSSEEFESEIYSHFINLRKQKELKLESEKREDSSMFELMRDISLELPTWNIHVSSNGEIFYLAQIDGMEEKPTMKKVVEIDLEYNAKVYVNGTPVPEYDGKYSSYEDIKQLVYDVDQL